MCRKLFLLVCFVLVLGFAGKASAVIYNEDIGNATLLPGSALEVGGVWTVEGSGDDIWGNGDNEGFHYVFQPVSGDCILEINLQSMELTDGWAKVGVMVRETTDAGSKHAAMLMSGSNGLQFAFRQNTDGGSDGTGLGGMLPPKKLRIRREGNQLTGEYWKVTPFGSKWEPVGIVTVAMDTDVLIGMVVCSNRTDLLCTAVIDSVNWTVTPCYRAWAQSPAEGATGLPQDLTLSWRPGEGATSHDVYLGTNPAALAPEAMGLTEPNCVLVSLEGDTTYYWRVDEHGASVTPGNVWSFKTAKILRPGTGTILREIWEGIGGSLGDFLANPAYPDSPTFGDEITAFDEPGWGDAKNDYGGRMQGWLVPLTAGEHEYTFWIASDDGSELWLSTTDKSSDAVLIASVSGWTNQYQWDKGDEPDQQSDPIPLVGGNKYFIRALWKEGGGGDHCAVAWEGPGTDESPGPVVIDGYYLSSEYVDYWAHDPSPENGAILTLQEAMETVTLSWRAAEVGVAEHDVYFGTNPTPPYLDTKALGDETIDVNAYVNETYYWQINEVNDAVVKVGSVWSFVTLPSQRIWREAEEPDTIGASFRIYSNPSASGGGYIGSEDNEGNANSNPDGSGNWTATYDVTVTGGVYRILVRARKATSDSFWYRIATGTSGQITRGDGWVRCNGMHVGDHWEWDEVHNDQQNKNIVYWTLAPGTHTIEISKREDGTHLDAFLITNDVSVDEEALAANIPSAEAAKPRPADGAVGTIGWETETLTWLPGVNATENRVRFGTAPGVWTDDVTKPLGDETYNPGPLALGTTYYWQVNDGDVWSFTTGEWASLDIRTVGGSAVQDVNGVWTIIADGQDIWNNRDRFHFVYATPKLTRGDCEIVARVWSLVRKNSWTKAGVMIRETLEGGSRNACTLMAPPDGENRATFQSRENTNEGCGSNSRGGVSTPEWVKLVREGDSFTGFHADDVAGSPGEWRQLGGIRTVVMPDDVYVGLAVTSHSKLNYTEAVIDNVNITTPDPQKSWGPSPADGAEGVPVVVRDKGVPIVKLLSWGEGYDAVGHLVWFGTNYDDVASGAPGTLKAVTMEPNYDPGILDLTETYYWAIDEISSRYDLTLGDIWSFTMSDHRSIDDFERYHVIPVEPPRGVVVEDGDLVEPIAPSDANLLVYYSFDDDDANDSSGNERHCTEQNGPSYAPGKVGQALELDGNGDHIVDEDAEDYLNGLDALTISLWIESDQTYTDKGFITLEDPSGNDKRNIRYDQKGSASNELKDVIGYGMTSTEGDRQSQSSGDVQTKSWQHLVMTWQSGVGMKLYINGVLDTPGWDGEFKDGPRGGVIDGVSKLIIGKGSKDGSNSWDGKIDEVKIYNYAVSYGEARDLAGETTALDVPTVYGSLVAEYTFDTDASDTSGNELDGTLVGGTIDGGVLHLDGNGGVDLGNRKRFNLGEGGDGPFSVSLWFNMSEWDGNWGNAIVGKRGENSRGWVLRRHGGNRRLTFTTRGPGADDARGNIEPSLNEWHHVVLVYDRDSQRKTVYLDGEFDTDRGGIHSIEYSGHNAYIGCRATKDNRGIESKFYGMIDDVRFYDHALTAIERLYLSGFVPTVFLSDTWTDSGEVSSSLEASLIGGSPHWGERAMRVDCNGDGEVSRDAPFEDWYDGASKTLVLYFKGAPDNAPEDMYVKITSAVGGPRSAQLSYDGDIDDLKIPVWQEWNIDLAELGSGKPEEGTGEGVPLPHVGAVAIGLTGTGTVLFDDLRLMTTRCVPKYSSLANFNNDCKVDLKDLRVITEDWLYGPNDNGLWYEYYEGYYGGLLPYFDVLAPVKQGPVNNFGLGVRNRNDGFALRFTGLIDVPADANYTFYTNSDDGSKLYIGDTQVVDNDGFHGMQWREGTIPLTAGKHPITVTMFEDGGGEGLEVEYASDAAIDPIARQPIPDDVLYRLSYPPSDLSEDNTVNFDDYGILADQWLDEVLFP